MKEVLHGQEENADIDQSVIADDSDPNATSSPVHAESLAEMISPDHGSPDDGDTPLPTPLIDHAATVAPPRAGVEIIQDDSGPPISVGLQDETLDAANKNEAQQPTSGRGLEQIDDEIGPSLVPHELLDPIVDDTNKASYAKQAMMKPEIIHDSTGPALPPSMAEHPYEMLNANKKAKASLPINRGRDAGADLGSNHISGGDSIVVPSREETELDTANNTDLEAQGQIDEEMLQASVHAIRPNDSFEREGGSDHSLPVIPHAYTVPEEVHAIEAVPILPWQKQRRTKLMLAAVLVVVGTLAIALGVSLSSKNEEPSVTLILVSNSPSISTVPTLQPTTVSPSAEPTDIPSTSMVPSASPTMCSYKISSQMQELDLQIGTDATTWQDSESGMRTPRVAVAGNNAVVVTGDWMESSGYVIFFSLDSGGNWQRVNTFSEEDEEYYSVAISGKTAFVGFPYARSGAGSVYIYEQNSSGVWVKDQTLIRGGEGESYSRFGWSLDVDGRFACVVNDRGTVYMFRRDEGYWDQFDELDIEYAHKCDIAGDVVAIRNWEGVLLYSIDEVASWGGVVPLQDTISTRADSTSLGQDYIAVSTNSSVIVYQQEETSGTFSVTQQIDSSDFREDAKYMGDNDDFLMSDDFYFNREWLDHGAHVGIGKGIMVVGGYNHTHIFSLDQDTGYWEEIATLDDSYDDYQLSGRNLLAIKENQIFSFNVEHCVPTPSQGPSASLAPSA